MRHQPTAKSTKTEFSNTAAGFNHISEVNRNRSVFPNTGREKGAQSGGESKAEAELGGGLCVCVCDVTRAFVA